MKCLRKMEKNEGLKIEFLNSDDWINIKNLLIYQLSKCKSEKDFKNVLGKFMASLFKTEKEFDETRTKLRLRLIDEKERKRIQNIEKTNEKEKLKREKREKSKKHE